MPSTSPPSTRVLSDRDWLPSQVKAREEAQTERGGLLLPYFHLQEWRPDFLHLQTRADALQRRMRRLQQEMDETRRSRTEVSGPVSPQAWLAGSDETLRAPRAQDRASTIPQHAGLAPQPTNSPVPIYAHTAQNPRWHDAPRQQRQSVSLAIPAPPYPARSDERQRQFVRTWPPRDAIPAFSDAHSRASGNTGRYPSFETTLDVPSRPSKRGAAVGSTSESSPERGSGDGQSVPGSRARSTCLSVDLEKSSFGVTERRVETSDARVVSHAEGDEAQGRASTGLQRPTCCRLNGSAVSADYGMITKGYGNQMSILIATSEDQTMELEERQEAANEYHFTVSKQRTTEIDSTPRRAATLPPSGRLRLITDVSEEPAQVPEYTTEPPRNVDTTPDPRFDSLLTDDTNEVAITDGAKEVALTNDTIEVALTNDIIEVALTDDTREVNVLQPQGPSSTNAENHTYLSSYPTRVHRRFACARVWHRLMLLNNDCHVLELQDLAPDDPLVPVILGCIEDVATVFRHAEYLHSEVVSSAEPLLLFADMPEAQEEERFLSLLDTIRRLEREVRAVKDELWFRARVEVGEARVVACMPQGPAKLVRCGWI